MFVKKFFKQAEERRNKWDCVKEGDLVAESYPRITVTGSGT